MPRVFSWLIKSQEEIDQELLESGWYFRTKDGKVKPKLIKTGYGFKSDPEWLQICIDEKVNQMNEEDWGFLLEEEHGILEEEDRGILRGERKGV